jgi:UDP-N-acetylmuramoyl-L-alanyl-D-glutamate--2,6-diaminopimelate ligase
MNVLKNIIGGLIIDQVKGNLELPVLHITHDSRDIREGTLFVAIPGTHVDGHTFIDQAIRAGAVAICCERLPEKLHKGITYLKVGSSSRTLGFMLSAFFDHPSHKLTLVGVTGTNGKTTTATLLYQLFKHLGYPSGLISTVRYMIGGKEIPSTHTTPDSVTLNRLMKDMVDQGVKYCFMEVSSHALVQDRIAGLQFTGGIFTNITHDHLDYHKTFSEYIKAKKRFFDDLSPDAFALINKDDRNAPVMIQGSKARKRTFALKSMADYRCRIVESTMTGMLLTISEKEWWTRLIGEFNAYNLLGVYAAALELGMDRDEVIRVLSELDAVEGRSETIRSSDGRVAIVDYAHTPDALENILKTLNQVKQAGQRIITVVGAGGDRDRAKRPKMAHIAASYSDKLILTSDNPRSEKPEDIIGEMKAGIRGGLSEKVMAIVNRREAIRTALLFARKGDVILVAGKGHETYQEILGVKHHFDDREEIRELFQLNPS